MDERQRQLAFLRFMEIEAELKALADCHVVNGDPAMLDAEWQGEKDLIAAALAEDYMGRRDG